MSGTNHAAHDAFSSDRPIETRAADLLGRARFADALAGAVSGWRGRESLVLGLYGSWGSGKSSIKNMLVEALSVPRSDGPIHILEFNPWQFANKDQLTEAFFREIGKKLGVSVFTSAEDRRRAVARWRMYSSYVKAGASLVEPLRQPGIYAALLALPLVSALVGYLNASLGLLVGLLPALLAALLLIVPRAIEALSDAVSSRYEALAKPLAEVKSELSRDLQKLEGQLLVILDDVDRLTPDELLILVQLVKANADFPRVVYLLLMDRDVVERSLERLLPVQGRSFLEKIVQVTFTVPNANQTEIDRLLTDRVGQILAERDLIAEVNGPRWGQIYIEGLRVYFDSLRRTYRFTSSLAFHVGLLRDGTAANINIVDFLALETLRVYEPLAYSTVARSKDLLTGYDWTTPPSSERDVLAGILEAVSEPQRGRLRRVLEHLFPLAAKGAAHNQYSEREWRRDQRVCSREYFDRYFELALGEDELRRSDVDALIASTRDPQTFAVRLAELKSRNLLEAGIRALEAQSDSIDRTSAIGIISVLLDIGEDLQPGSVLEISPDRYAGNIIISILRALDADARVRTLEGGIRGSAAVYLPIALLDGVLAESLVGFAIPDSVLEELKTTCLERVRSADPTTLQEHPHLGYVLTRWIEWGDADEALSMTRRIAVTPEGVLKLGKAAASRSLGTAGVAFRVALDRLSSWVPLDEVRERLSMIDARRLDSEDCLVLRSVLQQLDERRRATEKDGATPDETVPRRTRPRPLPSATQLEPVMGLLRSLHPESQVAGLEALRDLAYNVEIESSAEVMSVIDTLFDGPDPKVRRGILGVLGPLFSQATTYRRRITQRFLPRILELMVAAVPRDTRDLAVEAAAHVSDDARVIDQLVELLRTLPQDEVPEGQPPGVAYSLKNIAGQRGRILARLRKEAAEEPDRAIRERLLKTAEVLRSG
jgi:Cdc6-like AAA superfamily ATPase